MKVEIKDFEKAAENLMERVAYSMVRALLFWLLWNWIAPQYVSGAPVLGYWHTFFGFMLFGMVAGCAARAAKSEWKAP